MRTDYHPEAVEEYDRAVSYYATISPRLAAQFIEEIERCIELAAEAPTRWKEIRPNIRAKQAHVFPYQVLYMTLEDRVVILAVAHEKRDPDYWLSRTDWVQ